MVGQRRETLGQLQGWRGRLDMDDGHNGQQQFAQRENLAEKDGSLALLEGEDHRRPKQRQGLQQEQQGQHGLPLPEDFRKAAQGRRHYRITTKVAITAIIR